MYVNVFCMYVTVIVAFIYFNLGANSFAIFDYIRILYPYFGCFTKMRTNKNICCTMLNTTSIIKKICEYLRADLVPM